MTTANTVEVHCGCGQRGAVPAQLAGRMVRCRGCGQGVRVPDARAHARAEVAKVMAAAAPVERDGELDLLPPVERPTPDWEQRLRPDLRSDALPPEGRAGAGRRRRRSHAPEAYREAGRRDVVMEGHLRALALWQMVPAVLGAIVVLGLLVASVVGQLGAASLVLIAVPGALVVATYALGHFLWRYHSAARLIHLIIAALGVLGSLFELIAAPGVVGKLAALVGAIWPTAILLVLASPRAAHVCTPEYRDLVRRTPTVVVRWYLSPFFYAPFLLFLLAVGALLVAGVASAGF